MANRARNAQVSCFVCDRLGRLQQMPWMGNNIDKNQIAILRRAANGFADAEVVEETRICFNCNQSIITELEIIENDPTHLRLNVVNQRQNRACIICGAIEGTTKLSSECRSNVFVEANIYIPDGIRCCENHLNGNRYIFQPLILGLTYVNRPYVIPGTDLQNLLENMRQAAQKQDKLFNPDKLSEEEFGCLFSVNKAQFDDLLTFCDPVPTDGGLRYVHPKDLMMFLCKMRQGLSDAFLGVIFNYPTRQAVSMAICSVRLSLMLRFVPHNIGTSAITRENFIASHVTPFANELYNNEPDVPVAIVICDATYAYIHKSSNFRILRQSYSMHKGRHLLKPTLIVAPDGYILSILGPYFSDSQNNDADILRSEFERDTENLRDWFRGGDIMIVDRGYRDIIPLLAQLGIEHRMPAFLERGQRQFITEVANENRIITKVRWVVEARNGHIRSIFKMFQNVFNIQNARYIGDYYRIAGALINRYHPLITMENATVDMARQMLQRRNRRNNLQDIVVRNRLQYRRAQWIRLNNEQVPRFPRLSIEFLKDLTLGIYQINLGCSYIQDILQRDNEEEIQIDEHFDMNNVIRLQIYSRFRNRTSHQVFISFISEDELNPGEELINDYYCTCQSGARTLGTCAHIASILWYLGYARHQDNIRYPDESLLNTSRDAANRWQEDANGIEIIDEA